MTEHKNRHLFEPTRVLLLHMNISLCFLGGCCSYVLLSDKSHAFCVKWSNSSHYIVSWYPSLSRVYVFGCTCFVHNLTPRKDKLTAKAFKFLFLEYSHFQKGYHCYSLELDWYFMSADVTFDQQLVSSSSVGISQADTILYVFHHPPTHSMERLILFHFWSFSFVSYLLVSITTA